MKHNFTEYYKKLPMRKKLMLSFAVPLVILVSLIIAVFSRPLSKIYQRQIEYAVSQSCEQIDYYVTQNMANMSYISLLISESSQIQSILEKNINPNQDLADVYRKYYELNMVFNQIESANSSYRVGIYLPDVLPYTNNQYSFFPISQIYHRADYEKICDVLRQKKIYTLTLEENVSANRDVSKLFFTVLRAFEVNHIEYIAKVGIGVNEIRNTMNRAKSTTHNKMYLLDENNNFVVTTNTETDDPILAQFKAGNIQDEDTVADIGGIKYRVIYKQIEKYNWKLFSLIPEKEYRAQAALITFQMAGLILFLIIAIFIVANYIASYYARRLEQVSKHMKKLEGGQLNIQMNATRYKEGSGDEIDEIYADFNTMAMKLQALMKEHYKLGKSVMSAEIKALQAQINPHFLYNTLDLINWGAIEHGADDVAGMARHLGTFYRLSLNHGKSAIKIEEELKHVEAYIHIEKMHFPGAVNLMISVPDEIKEYACLNIILQPFVENAIVHGIAEHADIIECNIEIRAHMEEGDIVFEIEDDGPGIEKEKIQFITQENGKENGGYGIKNINFRLKLCYGEQYGVTYDAEREEGTRVFIRIPALHYEELEELLN